MRSDALSQCDILHRLSANVPVKLRADGVRLSAVLVPLRPMEADPSAFEVVLTRRSKSLPSHAGQVSFPGGGIDPADDGPVATALRETHEELGVPAHSVSVVGALDDMFTVTGFHVTPIVGLLDPEVPLVPNPGEVDRVFTVPLALLLDEARWIHKMHRYRSISGMVWHFPYEGEDIWGATAHMLRDLLEVVKQPAPLRP